MRKMATTEEIAPPVDHSTPKQDCPERKSLQTLQQSALDETALVGIGLIHDKPGKSTERPKFRPSHGQVRLYHDSSDSENLSDRQGMCVSTATQTDDSLLEDLLEQRLKERPKRDHSLVDEEENEAYELMVKEPVPESYWKEVAEQRRLALSDTLEENRSLHQSVESLKEDNEKLLELAGQAEQLSSLLQSVVSEEEEDSSEDKNLKNEEKEEEQATNNTDPEKDPDTQSTACGSPSNNTKHVEPSILPESAQTEKDKESTPSAVVENEKETLSETNSERECWSGLVTTGSE